MSSVAIAGIDFGAKCAGTTSICVEIAGALQFVSSKKGDNADDLILDTSREFDLKLVGIDAPLSLPIAYRNLHGNQQSSIAPTDIDFLYRKADREVGGMSPMFLGGLTARAIRLKHLLSEREVSVIEVYPRGLIRTVTDFEPSYVAGKRSKNPEGIRTIIERCEATFGPLPLKSPPTTWHELDSLLALMSVRRRLAGSALRFGDSDEGIIHL